MAAKRTIHVYPSHGQWAVKKEGLKERTFGTQKDAVQAARRSVNGPTQVTVHGLTGRIVKSNTYHMAVVQDPPRVSDSRELISNAVGKVTLKRVKAKTLKDKNQK